MIALTLASSCGQAGHQGDEKSGAGAEPAGKPMEKWDLRTLPELIGYSDAVVVGTFRGESRGAETRDDQGTVISADRLQEISVDQVLAGNVAVGESLVLLEDSYDGAGKPIQTGGLTWLKKGDQALYFLEAYDAGSLPYEGTTYRLVATYARVLRGPDGAAILADTEASASSNFVGLAFAEAVTLTLQSADAQSDAVDAARVEKASVKSSAVPAVLPAIVSTSDLGTVQDGSVLLTLRLVTREGGVVCYGLVPSDSNEEVTNCFTQAELKSMPIDLYSLTVDLQDSAVIMGMTNIQPSPKKVVVEYGTDSKTLDAPLSAVPDVTGWTFFMVQVPRGEIVTSVVVGK